MAGCGPAAPESSRDTIMRLTEQKYGSIRPFRSRGLSSLIQRVGDVHGEIRRLLGARSSVRVLELGCGFATVLLELEAHYPGKLELFGLNRKPSDGDIDLIIRNAQDLGLIVGEVVRPMLPTISYGDAGICIPYPDNYFDLVVSQMCFLYVQDKMQCLREVSRVLTAEGVALLDTREYRKANWPTQKRLEIWQGATEIDFWEYVARVPGLEQVDAEFGPCLRMRKSPNVGSDLELVDFLILSTICSDWIGTKSIYRIVNVDTSAHT
jgi:SAM-dependent methyltransferase